MTAETSGGLDIRRPSQRADESIAVTDGLILIGDEAFTPDEWAAVPHGTPTGYVHHGCRCTDCRRARADYYDKRGTR